MINRDNRSGIYIVCLINRLIISLIIKYSIKWHNLSCTKVNIKILI